MTIESIWKPNFEKESNLVYGTNDILHPAVNYLLNQGNKIYIGGKIKIIGMPNHYDYKEYRLTPNTAQSKFKELGWKRILAFQTRNPLHRAHIEMTFKSMRETHAIT